MNGECEKTRERMLDYLTGSVESAESKSLEEHIHACSTCHEALSEFRETWSLLDQYPGKEPSSTFLDQTLKGLKHQKRVGQLNKIRRMAVSLAACLLMGASLLFYFMTPSRTEKQEVEMELLENLALMEDLDFLEEYGEDLELAMEYDLYDILSERENL